MKVMMVFGTRPEAIKMCPLVIELKKHKEIQCIVCLTGQHREMLRQVMDVFGIVEDYNLDVMKVNQNLSSITSDVLCGIDKIIENEKPDLVLVHGDTSTTFSAALSSFYHNVPIGHVEAGLRTYDMKAPYPEEFNRQAVDLITELYFAPTEYARETLLKEKKNPEKIFVTGNTVIDALKSTVKETYQHEILDWAEGSRLILLTAHRRENLGTQMENIFRAINRLTEEFPDIKVVYPVHKNPKIREIVDRVLGNNEQIRIIEPLDVVDFHNFMAKSFLILTDSGGIQEEAPSLGIPVLVLRDVTERPEGVAAGTLKIVGTDEEKIYLETKTMLCNKEAYTRMKKASNPYGDGHASERIVEAIIDYANSINSITNL